MGRRDSAKQAAVVSGPAHYYSVAGAKGWFIMRIVPSSRFRFRLGVAVIAAALALPAPASAQFGFGSMFGKSKKSSSEDSSGGCDSAKPSIGKSILGSVIGRATGSALGRFGSWVPLAEVSGTLTDAIACQLDPDEQKQAADATLEVTRSETVGATKEWTSETRENVSGRSTVTEKKQLASGSTCMSVTDIVIIEGEETTVSKEMCKAPGEKRYTIMNA